MLTEIITHTKEKQNIIYLCLFFIFFLFIFIILDINNMPYKELSILFGNGVTLLHIFINILMSVIIAFSFTFSKISNDLYNKEPISSQAGFVSVILGFFTFGCTPCVVGFLSTFGIAFTPIIFPNGNLLWKLISLLIVTVGFVISLRYYISGKCKLK